MIAHFRNKNTEEKYRYFDNKINKYMHISKTLLNIGIPVIEFNRDDNIKYLIKELNTLTNNY